MYADKVKCNNCDEEMLVVVGTEVCPICKMRGSLVFVNENEPEVEVNESEIINIDDYQNVVNETEKSISRVIKCS